MKFTICDDSSTDLSAIESIINKYAKINNINIKIEKHNHPDTLIKQVSFKPEEYKIFFLDVVMQKNGIDISREIRKHCKDAIIVFATSSKEFAIDAFEVKAFNYLLKPLDEVKVFECIDSILDANNVNTQSFIKFKSIDKNILTINVKDISYIESISRRIVLHMKNGDNISSTSLHAKFLDSVPFEYEKCNFINCHASYIVNMNDIQSISEKSFIMKNGDIIPISKSLFSQVKKTYISYLVGE